MKEAEIMKDYTSITVPRKFIGQPFKDFGKDIGIISQEQLPEVMNIGSIKWLVLPKGSEPGDFQNNRRNKIVFFCNGFDLLLQELQNKGFSASRFKNATKDKLAAYYPVGSTKYIAIKLLQKSFDCDLFIDRFSLG